LESTIRHAAEVFGTLPKKSKTLRPPARLPRDQMELLVMIDKQLRTPVAFSSRMSTRFA
jgi:hypothetical protein